MKLACIVICVATMKTAFPFAFLATIFTTVTTVHCQSTEWIRQLGTTGDDVSNGVSTDGLGNVYIVGRTDDSLGGPNAGSDDAFVSKYAANGAMQWTRQLGSSARDRGIGVSADKLGHVYISGFTEGSLGGANAGDLDAFISMYDASGTLQWTRQLGTDGTEIGYGVSADGLGNVYLSGITTASLGGVNAGSGDAFISKYDINGAMQWTQQLGSSEYENVFGVSADGLGNVYLAGETQGSLGGPNAGVDDAFISKYDAGGTLQWTQQLGTNTSDQGFGVSADGLGNVYISGSTYGSLGGTNAGSGDAFISKYDASGAMQWTQQLGTSGYEAAYGLSADTLGNVYVSGTTGSGDSDIFIDKYDAAGVHQWTQFHGTGENEWARSVTTDGRGNIYVSGRTRGDLGALNAGGEDAFLLKLSDSSFSNADLNADELINCDDVDLLVSEIASANHGAIFDLNGDGLVDADDLNRWLVMAGAANLLSGNPYLPGDGNLDGAVDASDFNIWSSNRLSQTAAWCSGDFNADGFIDASDFNVWNSHRLMSSSGAPAAVPEQESLWLSFMALALLATHRRCG